MKIVVKNGDISDIPEGEKLAYIEHVKNEFPHDIIDEIIIEIDGEYVNLEVHKHSIPFSRIRRITGYLVGSLDRWNSAKRAEEADRTKHA